MLLKIILCLSGVTIDWPSCFSRFSGGLCHTATTLGYRLIFRQAFRFSFRAMAVQDASARVSTSSKVCHVIPKELSFFKFLCTACIHGWVVFPLHSFVMMSVRVGILTLPLFPPRFHSSVSSLADFNAFQALVNPWVGIAQTLVVLL